MPGAIWAVQSGFSFLLAVWLKINYIQWNFASADDLFLSTKKCEQLWLKWMQKKNLSINERNILISRLYTLFLNPFSNYAHCACSRQRSRYHIFRSTFIKVSFTSANRIFQFNSCKHFVIMNPVSRIHPSAPLDSDDSLQCGALRFFMLPFI